MGQWVTIGTEPTAIIEQELLQNASKKDDIMEEEYWRLREAAELFDRWSHTFIKWRWHTIYEVCSAMLVICPGMILLNKHYDDLRDHFHVKDNELWDAFMRALSTPEYWRQCKVLKEIVSWLISND